MHFGNPDFVLEGDPNPAKKNILFFKADKKYVYLEVVTMEMGTCRKSIFQ